MDACDSNYITLKQIEIIDTLTAKFRKAHDTTPQHDTFSNFGDTWKYLCSAPVSTIFFSVQRIVQGCHLSMATKVLVMDLYAVQYAIPARKPKTQNKTQKQQQTKQKQTNQKKTPGKGMATSNRDSCKMTSCVS